MVCRPQPRRAGQAVCLDERRRIVDSWRDPRTYLSAAAALARGTPVWAIVVAVDVRHGADPGILVGGEVLSARLLVPVVDAAHERRDQNGASLSAGDRLGPVQQQRHVALHTLALEDLCSTYSLPRRCELDEHALGPDA